jgi:hypothetical protein
LYVLQSATVLRIAAFAICASSLACGHLVRHPTYVPQPTSALVSVEMPPPPARVEIVPTEPSATAVWVDGEWMWRRERWAWLPGRWVEQPAGVALSPWVFVRGLDGALWYAPGVWRDAKGAPVDPPPALSVASVETGAVVTAEGVTEVTGPNVRDRPRPAASTDQLPTSPTQ